MLHQKLFVLCGKSTLTRRTFLIFYVKQRIQSTVKADLDLEWPYYMSNTVGYLIENLKRDFLPDTT